jgi:hypothetical protein
VDPRIWLGVTAGWSAVEFALRNPHQITLERRSADSPACAAYSLRVRSWWSLLVRSRGQTVALGPDSRLVRNVGVIDCATGKLVELRIYRWHFAELVRAFALAGFEVHDECEQAHSRLRALAPILLISVVAVAAMAVAAVEIHGL